ncbi:MAG: hypothetical protein J5770_01660 [Bacteroidaceae bacterium]|nr:hypothetical protein [Bacteroidaceae bacterium]
MKHLVITLMIAMLAGVANAQNPKRSELTIVDKVEIKLTAEEARHINASQRVSVDLTDALAKMSSGGLGMALHKFYIAEYDEQTEGKTDELTSTYNYRNGWWLTDIYDETTGELTGECVADTVYTPLMYIRDIELDDKQLSMTVGQVANTTIPGNIYSALLYYINGSNAIEIAVSLTITDAIVPKLEELTKVGERNLDVSMYYNGSYKYRSIEFPTDSLYDAIYETLPQPDCVGYEEGKLWGEDMKLVLYAEREENVIDDYATAFYGGYWVDANGYICNHGENAAIFCEPENWDMNVFHVGIYPNYKLIDTTVKAKLYIVGANCYYQLNLKVTITPQPTLAECVLAETLNYAMEIVPENNGTESLIQADYMVNAISLHDIVEQHFESADLVFATYTYIPGQGYGPMPSATNILNTPIANVAQYGYQMTDISFFAEMMGDESMLHLAVPMSPNPPLSIAYGICYNDSTLSFWQPDGVRQVGDFYTAEYYLYSLDDMKKVKLNINVIYVDQRNPIYNIVGTRTVELPQSNAEGTDYGTMTIDLTDMLTALECSNINEIQWAAYNNLGQLLITPDFDDIYGYYFDANGYLTTEETKVFCVGFADGAFHSLLSNGTADTDYSTSIVAVYNGKGYKFNVKVTKDPQNDTGIASLPSPLKGGSQVYNLSGMHINTNTLPLRERQGVGLRGIYIINGKKVLVR